jgi:hypothetical protein
MIEKYCENYVIVIIGSIIHLKRRQLRMKREMK